MSVEWLIILGSFNDAFWTHVASNVEMLRWAADWKSIRKETAIGCKLIAIPVRFVEIEDFHETLVRVADFCAEARAEDLQYTQQERQSVDYNVDCQ